MRREEGNKEAMLTTLSAAFRVSLESKHDLDYVDEVLMTKYIRQSALVVKKTGETGFHFFDVSSRTNDLPNGLSHLVALYW